MESGTGHLQDLVQRMKRIEGQARGVRRMLEEGQDCQDTLVQIAAMRAALNKVALAMLGCHLAQELRRELSEGGDGRASIDRAVEVFARFS
ncbi:MAG: metal-sensitive transcriptional regulator [Bacillota bacterium]